MQRNIKRLKKAWRLHILIAWPILLFGLSSCTYSSINSKPKALPIDEFFHPYYDITSLPIADTFQAPKNNGSVEDLALEEISGIAASYAVPNALWAEEDSGNENKIYLLDLLGKTKATFRMTSIDDRDWEDMSFLRGRCRACITFIWPRPETTIMSMLQNIFIGFRNHHLITKLSLSVTRLIRLKKFHFNIPMESKMPKP